MTNIAILKELSFGKQVAEEEENELEGYFIQTNEWNKIFYDEVDIVYGPKGSGKSAIYTLLNKRKDELFIKRNIVLKLGENPRGTSVFKQLNEDPPTCESDFQTLWKLYIAVLCIQACDEAGVDSGSLISAKRILAEGGVGIKRGWDIWLVDSCQKLRLKIYSSVISWS